MGKFQYFSPFCVGLTYKRRRNVLKSHLRSWNGIFNNMKRSDWCFANFHSKPRSKISEKYSIFQLWSPKTIFAPRCTATPPIVPDAEFHKESFEVWIVVAQRCTKKLWPKNGQKIDFIHEYSKKFEKIRYIFECF